MIGEARAARRPGRAVLQAAAGNFLEMYDFMAFGFYAPAIGRAFFPAADRFASLMLALLTFGTGFLMRPLGAVVLGAYIDRSGRRAGLILTLGLMAAGTALIALTPGYASIGALAPVLVVAGRLLQGFSAGAELGGVSVYLSELAPPGRKGLYVSAQSASQQLAVVFAALQGAALHRLLSPRQLDAWGWRIPFVVGCLAVPLLLALRRSLPETARHHPERGGALDALRSLAKDWRRVACGSAMVVLTTVSFYMITAYTPAYGVEALGLGEGAAMAAAVTVGLSNLLWLPVMGALSDRVGRRGPLLAFSLLAAAFAYPALRWLAAAPSLPRLLAVQLGLSLAYAGYNGAMVVALVELLPARTRTSGFSLAYSAATALFGGFTPALCAGLIHATGDRAAPGAWLTAAALCSAGAALAWERLCPRSALLPSARADVQEPARR